MCIGTCSVLLISAQYCNAGKRGNNFLRMGILGKHLTLKEK